MDPRGKMVTRDHPEPPDPRGSMVFLVIEEKEALKERKANLENKVISTYLFIILQNLRVTNWSIPSCRVT